jgi:hypothetical protein
MAEITTSGSDADLSFEVRWRKALEQPEVSIVDAKKIEIDASPSAILAHLRAIADVSHAKGELSKQALDNILACGDQLESAFKAMAPAKLQNLLGILKRQLREAPPR